MIAPEGDGPEGPMMIAGSLWRRWRRSHPSENFADFLRSVSFHNLGIRQKCTAVSSETLLRRRVECETRHSTRGVYEPPLLVQVPKEEPIELSSDSSGPDVNMAEIQRSTTSKEACRRLMRIIEEQRAELKRRERRLRELSLIHI